MVKKKGKKKPPAIYKYFTMTLMIQKSYDTYDKQILSGKKSNNTLFYILF